MNFLLRFLGMEPGHDVHGVTGGDWNVSRPIELSLLGLLIFVGILLSVVNFLPDMQLALQAQYDNISQNFALSLRYRWEYEPGQELFVSVGQGAVIPGQTFVPHATQAAIRLGHTFRY